MNATFSADLTTLDAATLTALSKTFADAAKDARDNLAVGKVAVNATVTIAVSGEVVVGADTEKTPTASIPVKEVLALFIARSGCTREAGIRLLRECLTDALTHGVEGAGVINAAADIDAEFKAEVSRLTASLPKTPVRGSVKVKATTTVVA